MLRLIAAVLVTACLAACATPTPPNPMTREQRNAYVLRKVEVVWAVPDERRTRSGAFRRSRAFVDEKLPGLLMDSFRHAPLGDTPVTFRVVIRELTPDSAMTADVQVVRIDDGAVVATYPDVTHVMVAVSPHHVFTTEGLIGGFAMVFKQRFHAPV